MKKIISLLICAVIFIGSAGIFAVKTSAAAEFPLPHYYTALSANQQRIYNQMRAAVLACEPTVTLGSSVSGADLTTIANLLYYYDPAVFNLKDLNASMNYNSTALRFEYHFSKTEHEKRAARMAQAAEEIIAKIPEGLNHYNRIKFVHDELVKNCVYDVMDADAAAPYGALVNGRAKCDGYARAFAYLLGRMGVKNALVIGDYLPRNEAHMWNKVYYNAKWYNIDVTNDDPVSSMKQNLKHTFFMVSDGNLKKTHREMNIGFAHPEASDDSMAFYRRAGSYVNAENAASALRVEFIRASREKRAAVTVQLTSEAEYKKAVKALIDEKGIYKILENANKNKNASNKFADNYYLRSLDANSYTITVYIFYPNTPLSDYYDNPKNASESVRKNLAKLGIK